MTSPDYLSRVRTEFNELVGANNISNEVIREELTYDNIRDLKLLGYAFQESLRLSPVAATSTLEEALQDAKFGWL